MQDSYFSFFQGVRKILLEKYRLTPADPLDPFAWETAIAAAIPTTEIPSWILEAIHSPALATNPHFLMGAYIRISDTAFFSDELTAEQRDILRIMSSKLFRLAELCADISSADAGRLHEIKIAREEFQQRRGFPNAAYHLQDFPELKTIDGSAARYRS